MQNSNFLAIWYLLLVDIGRETPHIVWPPPQWRHVWSPHSWSYPGVQSHQQHVLPSQSAAEYIYGDVTCWHCKPRPGKVSKFCAISPLGVCSEAWWCFVYACILVARSAVLSWPQGKKKPGSELLVSIWPTGRGFCERFKLWWVWLLLIAPIHFVSLAIHTLHRARKGLVTLQLTSFLLRCTIIKQHN